MFIEEVNNKLDVGKNDDAHREPADIKLSCQLCRPAPLLCCWYQYKFTKLGKLNKIPSQPGCSFKLSIKSNLIIYYLLGRLNSLDWTVYGNQDNEGLTWGKKVSRRSGVLIARVLTLMLCDSITKRICHLWIVEMQDVSKLHPKFSLESHKPPQISKRACYPLLN